MMNEVEFYRLERTKEDGIPCTILKSVMHSVELFSDQRVKLTGYPKDIIDFVIGMSLLDCTLLMMCPQCGMSKERGERLTKDILILIKDAINEKAT